MAPLLAFISNLIARQACASKAQMLGFEVCNNSETAYGDVDNVAHNIFQQIENGEAVLNLNIPVVAIAHDQIGLARNVSGHWRLIGWGEIVE